MSRAWRQPAGPDPVKLKYEAEAWPDFIQNQIGAFGSLPVFLGKGNHETAGHKTPSDYLHQFENWLNHPTVRDQRLPDHPPPLQPPTYSPSIHAAFPFI